MIAKEKLQKIKKPRSLKRSAQRTQTLLAVALFAVVGTALLVVSMAATPATRIITNADQAALANGFTVPAGEVWEFDPNQDVKIETRASVIVLGTLRMQPKSHDIEHYLRFVNIDESKFTGGCVYPDYPVTGCGVNSAATDVGLWVTTDGVLEANGSNKTSWTRLAGAANAGATTITLENTPVGWNVGDEISITPTAAPTVNGFSNQFDLRTITAINGSQVTLNSGLQYNHPQIPNPGPGGGTFRAEVLNLSRNVKIEGQDATHRSHVALQHLKKKQTITNVGIRYMGPHHAANAAQRANNFVLGRYGLHFHMNSRVTSTDVNDGTRRPTRVVNSEYNWEGALVDGVVVRDTDSHAFVVHESDNVTLKNTISYSTSEEPYWWDEREFQNPLAVAQGNTSNGWKIPINSVTNNVTYDHAVAALVRPSISDDKNFRASGFFLATGSNMTVKNSVAVGVADGVQSSGFHWPEGDHTVWNFNEGNIAHNNAVYGTFGWQNDNGLHDVEDLVSYHNGEAGVAHGAYQNNYKYTKLTIIGNGEDGFQMHAATTQSRPLALLNSIIEGSGIANSSGLTFEKHSVPTTTRTRIVNTTINNVTNKVAVRSQTGSDGADLFDFEGVNVTPADFRVFRANPTGTNVRVQPFSGTPFQFTDASYTPQTIAPFTTISQETRGADGPWTVPSVSLQFPDGSPTPPSPTPPTPTPPSQPPANADINGDGRINIADLSMLLANWNSRTNTQADLNKDGVVNVLDLSLLLSRWTR